MDIIVTGLTELQAALAHAEADVGKETRQVVSRGALQVKKEWQQRWSRIAHAPHIPRSINYDLTTTGDGTSADIGPDRALGPELQGFLGSILEYGGIHSGPNPGGLPAIDAEEPRFERAMGDLGESLLD